MIHRLTINGKPPVKKNRMMIVVNRQTEAKFLVPNAKYKKWHKAAIRQLQEQWRGKPIEGFVHVKATFYLPDLRRVDLSNLLEAPADALEEAEVIEDDYFISNWDGSRRALDRTRPRIELIITSEAGE